MMTLLALGRFGLHRGERTAGLVRLSPAAHRDRDLLVHRRRRGTGRVLRAIRAAYSQRRTAPA
jgi:hypothetical protein